MASLEVDDYETTLTAPLLDPEFYAGDPFPLYARLRAEAPVARNDTLGLVGGQPVTPTWWPCPGIRALLLGSKGIMTFEIGATYATPPTMMHTDPPDHTRYRNLVQPGFRPSFMRALEDGIRQRARRPWWTGSRPGPPVDVVAELAVPTATPGDQRPAGRAGGRMAPLLPMVRGGHPRGHRLAGGGAGGPQRRRW